MAQVGKFHDDERHVTLHYELFNSGPTKVLLIMGLLTDCEAWMPLVDELVQDDELQICIFDNRGLPRSPAPSGRYTTSEMAKDAARLAKHLGWDKYHVVGTSMGGMIAQELALLAGDDTIQSLSLLCTHAGGKTARAPLAGTKIFLKSFTTSDPQARLGLVTELLYGTRLRSNPEKFDKVKDFHWSRIQKQVRGEMEKPSVCAVNTHHLSEHKFAQLRNAKFPIVVMTGDEDILVCPNNTHLLAEKLECEKHVFEGMGHGMIPHHEDLVPILKKQWSVSSQEQTDKSL